MLVIVTTRIDEELAKQIDSIAKGEAWIGLLLSEGP